MPRELCRELSKTIIPMREEHRYRFFFFNDMVLKMLEKYSKKESMERLELLSRLLEELPMVRPQDK